MKKVFIALPIRRYIEPECLETIYTKIYRENDTYIIGDFCQMRGSPNIYMQRYNLAQRFLKTDCDYYLYLDTDQTIVSPDNAIELMVQADKDILSPIIVRRFFPHLPACISKERYSRIRKGQDQGFFEDFRQYKDPFEVYYCCGGLVLIKRKVIEQVKDPFKPVYDERTKDLLSVDYSLFYKAKKLGFRCWCDPRLTVAHIGHFPFVLDDYYAIKDTGQLTMAKEENNDIFELKNPARAQ